MNLKSLQKQTLDEVINGWYISKDEIISSTNPSKYVKYEKFERIGDYLKVDTPFGEEVYVFKDNNGIYKVEKEIGGYSLLRIKDKYAIGKDGKISSEFDKIDWEVENGIAYGEIRKDGKLALIRFDGKEEISTDWYDKINWKVEEGIFYGEVEKDGKNALMRWDGKEEISTDWYNDRYNGSIFRWEIENGVLYGEIESGKMFKNYALVRLDEKGKEFHGPYSILNWKVENGIFYGKIGKNSREAFVIWDKKLLTDWFEAYIKDWKVWNGTIYGIVERRHEKVVKWDGKEEISTDWYNKINWKFKKGIIYMLVEKDGKSAFVKWDGKEEISTDWYDYIWDYWEVENGIVYGKVKRNGKFALMKWNEKEEKLTDEYDKIWKWGVEDGIVYAKFNKNDDWKEVEFLS